MLLALTGYSQPDDLEHAKEAGFEQHFLKPVSLDLLQEVISNVR